MRKWVLNTNIGWSFPPTSGGRVDGYNDPGIAHFSGAPLSSLARKVIQNSLDARGTPTEPVHVSFELIDLRSADLGKEELAQAIQACKDEANNDPDVDHALETALKTINQQKVRCLQVSDRNTTGLRGEHWRALVKMQGTSVKGIEGAGGSHGIGKYAPFAVSVLRTVFYHTCYQENGQEVELSQGKSVLMSHHINGTETQGTGFYGIKDSCRELRDSSVPDYFRVSTPGGRPVNGTSLVIAGFSETRDWQKRIASSVIENFFYAIGHDRLKVIIEPDSDLQSRGLLQMDSESLGGWFAYLQDEGEEYAEEGDTAIGQAHAFWQLANLDSSIADKQDPDLGHCRLYIRVAEGLPKKVGFVRHTGMLVTTEQAGLKRFDGFQDFAALCVFEDPKGNELLRKMENPQHNQFEPHRLSAGERERGQRALRRIGTWIRGELRAIAGPPEGGVRTMLSELATLLPDRYPDEEFDFDNDGDTKPGFGERVTVRLKPARRVASPTLPPEEHDDANGDNDGNDTGVSGGAGTGEGGGGGSGGGTGEGDRAGGTGTRGGGKVGKAVPLSGVRILPVEASGNRYQLSFRGGSDGKVRLTLEEAGDLSSIPRSDVRAVGGASLDAVNLDKGKRHTLEITADDPIGGRAWRLSAVAVEADS